MHRLAPPEAPGGFDPAFLRAPQLQIHPLARQGRFDELIVPPDLLARIANWEHGSATVISGWIREFLANHRLRSMTHSVMDRTHFTLLADPTEDECASCCAAIKVLRDRHAGEQRWRFVWSLCETNMGGTGTVWTAKDDGVAPSRLRTTGRRGAVDLLAGQFLLECC